MTKENIKSLCALRKTKLLAWCCAKITEVIHLTNFKSKT